MKAAYLEGNTQPYIVKEIPTPVPTDQEVLIKLEYSAFNQRDIRVQKGIYAGAPLPEGGLAIGSDGYGKVVELGKNADPSWLGKSVVINPGRNWGDNPDAFGPDFTIMGSPDQGTFAEYIAVDQQYIQVKPAHLTEEEAGALPLAGLTTYRAVFTKARLRAGEKVLVTGIGAGTALLALEFAIAAGAEVYVTSGTESKLQRAIAMGAKGGFNYKDEDWATQANAKTGGFDVVLDSASGKGFAKLITVLKPGGRLVFWGGTDGPIENIVPASIYWKNLSILGTTLGNNQEFADMLAFSEKHNIKPVIDKVFPSLAHAQEAAEYLASGAQFGKVVLRNIV
ncbi:zinc-binding dehydrogenase [Pedobacter nyackensis]|uniref:NADPH:quinone reductase n=1 Tax=Pedobacter nyackensis TaxID=475255 RepID=A0A1W2CA89_9SPHI|nr:zinc-binding dehydrogenase [Pedobacter nyackensis]SMC82069.1 NADPH:quinone reductase [Pedobacter nyackensis]